MNRMKKLLCALLVGALTLCLCACSGGIRLFSAPLTLEQKLARAAEQMQQLKSLHMDLEACVGVTFNIAGESIYREEHTHNLLDLQTEPMKMYVEMQNDQPDEGSGYLCYAEQDGDTVNVYSSYDGGATWSRSTAPSLTELPAQNTAQQALLLLSCAATFTETGKETVNGSEATVYSGLISGELVEQAVKASGVMDSVAEALGGLVTEDMLKDLGDIPVSIAIDDESCMLVRYTMDMSQVMQSLMERLLGSVLDQYGLEQTEAFFKLEKVTLSVTLSQFDSVEEIVIPEAARAA